MYTIRIISDNNGIIEYLCATLEQAENQFSYECKLAEKYTTISLFEYNFKTHADRLIKQKIF